MDIPTKIINEITDIYSDYLPPGFNDSFRISTFPSSLKQENITAVFKKGDKNVEENYRLVRNLFSQNNSVVFGKAFDCLSRELLPAKQHMYGFSLTA